MISFVLFLGSNLPPLPLWRPSRDNIQAERPPAMHPHQFSRPVLSVAFIILFTLACGSVGTIPASTPGPTPATAVPSALSPGSSTLAPAEVLGSILLENGRSAAGGPAGSTIQVQVSLWATSTAGKVTDMRVAQVSGCESAGQVDRAQWEPFASRKSLPATLALNWIGYAVAAQFRDDHGITSLIYCDDISLEGMPAVPSVGSTDWYSQVQC